MTPADVANALEIGATVILVLVSLAAIILGLRALTMPMDNYQSPHVRKNVYKVPR